MVMSARPHNHHFPLMKHLKKIYSLGRWEIAIKIQQMQLENKYKNRKLKFKV